MRPRVWVYIGFFSAGVVALTLAFSSRKSFEANLLRSQGAAFVVEDTTVRDAFTIHVVNKRDSAGRFALTFPNDGDLTFATATTTVDLEPLHDTRVGLVVSAPRGHSIDRPFTVLVTREDDGEVRKVEGRFVGPTQ